LEREILEIVLHDYLYFCAAAIWKSKDSVRHGSVVRDLFTAVLAHPMLAFGVVCRRFRRRLLSSEKA
jgi:hypothetical protein